MLLVLQSRDFCKIQKLESFEFLWKRILNLHKVSICAACWYPGADPVILVSLSKLKNFVLRAEKVQKWIPWRQIFCCKQQTGLIGCVCNQLCKNLCQNKCLSSVDWSVKVTTIQLYSCKIINIYFTENLRLIFFVKLSPW